MVDPLLGNRRLLLAAAGLVLVVIVGAAVLMTGGGKASGPPADEATKLIPAGALVYLHVSTDTGRPATKRARALAESFPGFATAQRSLVRRLSAPGCKVDTAGLEGKEAAMALIDTGTSTAGSLVLVDTGADAPEGARDKACGQLRAGRIGRFLAIGQAQTLQLARGLASGHGRSLAGDPLFRKATDALPGRRVADGWVSAAGVRRLLAPQSGLLGAAGVLLDQPGLRAATFGVTAQGDHTARLTVRTEVQPGSRKAGASATFEPFVPTLTGVVPRDVLAYLGLRGLGGAAGRLLTAAGPGTAQLGPLLQRAVKRLGTGTEQALDRDVLALFRQETAVVLLPRTPAPILTVIARTKDEDATRRVLDGLRTPLANVLAQPGTAKAPAWRQVGGAWQLKPATGIELDYAVGDGRLIVSTGLDGIRAVQDARGHIADSEAWKEVGLDATPKRVSSVVFLDFRKLLSLGEQTGLGSSAAYQGVKGDLQRVRAVGAQSSRGTNDTTTEILLSIP